MKSYAVLAVAIIWIVLPGMIYWNVSENFSTKYVSSISTFEDGERLSALYSCEKEPYGPEVVACTNFTEFVPYTTGERVIKSVASSVFAACAFLFLLVGVGAWQEDRLRKQIQAT